MHIPSYQIHNVLKVYSRQVRLRKSHENGDEKENISHVTASEGKRKSIIRKVASDIRERVTNFGPGTEKSNTSPESAQKAVSEKNRTNLDDNIFVFNVIDKNDQKTTNTLVIENSILVKKKIE